ncbi:uncharacterized protein GGS25DRAFT_136205 [Hypoxylon fragiforme]|uniref:uncharacterized protein n=1 Tax=Hypoxylon fragiforme TaxID=63214 RepID=UPI0020C6D9EB|nr:uncharacterized protein GGS25DRAFT_136205 [Hypoxylon fragiforme]KAI2612804.1 hypothetical protein GGS25DRAFT_136205 [Hypoxylon fragiforme]
MAPSRPPSSASTPISNADNDDAPSTNDFMKIAAKSLQTGAMTGGIGLLVGAGTGIVRSAPPVIFAIAASLQWFALGSTYMASRSLVEHAWGGEKTLGPSDAVKASGLAGGMAGMVGGMIRGPRNIIPGTLFFGTAGTAGMYISQRFKASPKESDSAIKPKSSWLDSKWIPMKRLSDKEYEEMLEEKILHINAEISIIDDNIASLQESRKASTESAESAESAESNERK